MEAFLGHLIHFSLWVFFVIFAFAVFGFVVAVRWIAQLVTRTQNAVGAGIHRADDVIHRR